MRISSSALAAELPRKLIHLATVVVPLTYAFGARRYVLAATLCGVASIALLIEAARLHSRSIERLFEACLGPILRERERTSLTGATWLLLSFSVLVALAPPPVAIAGTWAVAVGDTLAALVGLAAGGPSGTKTLAGSLACAVGTVAGALVLARLPVAESLVAGASAAVAERPMLKVDDNMRITLAVWAGIFLWRMAFS